jgi:hypothetical protein
MLQQTQRVELLQQQRQPQVLGGTWTPEAAMRHQDWTPPTGLDQQQEQWQQQQQQEEDWEQQRQSAGQGSSSSRPWSSQPGSSGDLYEYQQFGLTAGIVGTVPNLLHLFEKGWSPDRRPEEYIYKALIQSQYKGSKKSQRVQWDNMRQCYTLLQQLSILHGISTEQAAAVVELWRLGNPTAYVLPAGTVTEVAADGQQEGSSRIDSLLSNASTGKVLGLDAVTKQARDLDIVQQVKNPKRAAAGRLGGLKSAEAKRQRREGSEGEGSA